MSTDLDRQVENAESTLHNLIQEVKKIHDDVFAAQYPRYDDDPAVSATKRDIKVESLASKARKLEQDSVEQLGKLLDLYRKQVSERRAQGNMQLPSFNEGLHHLPWAQHPLTAREFEQKITY